MGTTSSAQGQKALATTAEEGGASTAPITLSERSMSVFAIVRIFVGYLWFQQLFWKLPPDFKGLYPYIQREVQYAFIPGYGSLLQHTFLLGCVSTSSPAGCTLFVPLAAGVWVAELIVSVSVMFGLFTRFGALLSTLLALQLYVGLSTSEWYSDTQWHDCPARPRHRTNSCGTSPGHRSVACSAFARRREQFQARSSVKLVRLVCRKGE